MDMSFWFGGNPVAFDDFSGAMNLFIQGAPYEFSEFSTPSGTPIDLSVVERRPKRIQIV